MESAEPDRIQLQRPLPSAAASEIGRAELLDLLKSLMDEYRFQVKLNSDRTQVYIALNAAIITAGTGLLKTGGVSSRTLVAAIFVLGISVARLAERAVRQGHGYYRSIVYKKTLVEDLLGRHQEINGYDFRAATLAVETTTGMSSQDEILGGAQKWLARPVGSKTITGGLIFLFRMFVAVNALAIVFVVLLTISEFWERLVG